ncbi:hypothetical protein ACDT16_13735, partial [Staphylococcus aureus]
LLTDQTTRDKPGYLPLHAIPPEMLTNITVHLGAAWMNRILRTVSLCHDLLPDITTGYTKTTTKPECSILMNA